MLFGGRQKLWLNPLTVVLLRSQLLQHRLSDPTAHQAGAELPLVCETPSDKGGELVNLVFGKVPFLGLARWSSIPS